MKIIKIAKLMLAFNLCIGVSIAEYTDSEFTKCDIYNVSIAKNQILTPKVTTVAWLSHSNGRAIISAPRGGHEIVFDDTTEKISKISFSSNSGPKSQIFTGTVQKHVDKDGVARWSAWGNFAGVYIGDQAEQAKNISGIIENAKCISIYLNYRDYDQATWAKHEKEILDLNTQISATPSEHKGSALELSETLEVYKFIRDYPTSVLENSVKKEICLPNTSKMNCDANIDKLSTDFNFKLDQISNGSPVAAYAIQYKTPGIGGENRSVSGGVLIPKTPVDKIKGIVLYFHGTSLAKFDVPSCLGNPDLKYCRANTTRDGQLLGGILASQGYIVVMPDYIGLGFDSSVLHPYIFYSRENALSGLNMVAATRTLLKELRIPKIPTN